MPLISWEDKYSVRIASIDQQHQRLFELINRLYDAMKDGKADAVIAQVLEDLVEYTVQHFSFEEMLFARHGYPEAIPHKEEHRKLVEQVSELQEKMKKSRGQVTIETLSFLKGWLRDHILGVDLRYSTFLGEKGVK